MTTNMMRKAEVVATAALGRIPMECVPFGNRLAYISSSGRAVVVEVVRNSVGAHTVRLPGCDICVPDTRGLARGGDGGSVCVFVRASQAEKSLAVRVAKRLSCGWYPATLSIGRSLAVFSAGRMVGRVPQ